MLLMFVHALDEYNFEYILSPPSLFFPFYKFWLMLNDTTELLP